MRKLAFLCSVMIAIGTASDSFAEERLGIKVLFAGDLKSDRTRDYETFLKRQFTEVGLADYLTLKEAQTKAYDVILLDWPGMPPRTERESRRTFIVPELGPGYDRPTILIGGGSLGVGRRFQLKVDDLCVCLGDAAYGIHSAHEMFHRPHQINLIFEDRPTPAEYRNWPEGEHLGAHDQGMEGSGARLVAGAPRGCVDPGGHGRRLVRIHRLA